MSKKAILNVLFLIRKNRLSATGESPVYMRITALGKNTEISINRSINPKNWSSEIGGAIGNSRESKMLNSYIESIRVQLRQIFIDLRERNELFDVKHIKNLFLGIEENDGIKLIELMKEHNCQVILILTRFKLYLFIS